MKIVKTKEIAWADSLQKGNYGQRRKELGGTGKALSAGMWELAPGKKSFPFHKHHVTEEALFVISGTGKVRADDGLHDIGTGDFVAFPPGGAHQLINDSTEPLVYVAVGVNSVGVDVVEYPDTKKIAASIFTPERKRFVFDQDKQSDYFAGDKDAE